MLPRTVSLALAAAADNNISTSQTPGAAGNLTITGALASGGVATLDVPRRVLVTVAADEHTKTITIYGTDRNGNAITSSPTLPSAAGVVYTDEDFKTVTRVAISAATTGALKVGTTTVGSSRWLNVNYNTSTVGLGIRVKVTGVVTYRVEKTLDELFGHYSPGVGVVWNTPPTPMPIIDGYLSNQGASGETIIASPCTGVRLTVLTGTGTAEMIVVEQDIRG